MEEGDIFEQGESYRKEVLSFQDLFLMQVRRVLDKQSQEMREGFYVYSTTPNMTPQRTRYVGDSREEYFNSIKALHDLTQPKFDEEMKKIAEEVNKELDERYAELKEQEDTSGKSKINTWRNEQVKIYRKMFQAISFFGNRMNWFESTPTEE